MPAGPCSRWTMRKSSCSPRVAPRLEAVDVVQRLVDRGVRAPREPARDLGVAGELEQRGRVLADGQAQGQRGTMQRDAGAAVRHPREPTGAGGRAGRRPRGGREALPAGRRLRGLRRLAGRVGGPPARAARTPPGSAATSIAGRRPSRPTASPRAAASRAAARCSTPRPSPSSARCPRAPPSATARARGTPRPRPTSPPSGPSRATTSSSCSRASPTGGWSSATSTSPSIASARTRSSSSRPGAVGIPLDGDHRAAWALMHDDGRIERRRVAYDHAASAARVREVADGAPWGDVIAGRIERAGLA